MASSSSLPVPKPSGLANRRLTARALSSLVIPPPPATLKPTSNATLLNLPTITNRDGNNNDSPPIIITPAMAHFPPVCPPAPAPQTHRQLHPLPTIVLPDLQADDNLHHHPPATANPILNTHPHNMKAQPTTTLTSARARVNTVYPPSKRALSYNNAAGGSQRQPGLSPKSMAVASVLKRKGMSSPRPQTQRSSSSSAAYGAKQITPPQQQARPRISQQAHERALAAHRNAALAHRQTTRLNHLSSLDRGIQLLLEEEYREDVKAWMLEKEVGNS
ncbi:hypothetical protein M407DRAFT_28837 [Tulasnella calospora MUT 4182]|uniref:Uncharacterized protein n=1 Tax=Tulasnella calospora MUT 4182 TaxID=1051891 RepID=A0A0C3QB86_9AGAM|nr:hypothetical protein M407DRAFT_28837 [Tulasnella calospora MUT 4182]